MLREGEARRCSLRSYHSALSERACRRNMPASLSSSLDPPMHASPARYSAASSHSLNTRGGIPFPGQGQRETGVGRQAVEGSSRRLAGLRNSLKWNTSHYHVHAARSKQHSWCAKGSKRLRGGGSIQDFVVPLLSESPRWVCCAEGVGTFGPPACSQQPLDVPCAALVALLI